MSKVQVVVGGFYGSEGKGSIASALAEREPNMLAVRVGGPNAGHCVVDDRGQTWKLRQIPVAAVTNHQAVLAIGAGSEIDERVLEDEILALEGAGYDIRSRLLIDGMVTLIRDSHRARETALVRDIGSTGKGIGAARADRVMRSATVWGDDHDEAVFVGDAIRAALQDGWTVQVEGAQGYGLGLHTRFYPFCTSGDCRAIDMLAAAGVSPWFVADDAMASMEVWLVYRSLPIRVAGPSGPLEDETTWGELGLPPEHTTVTNRVRRVGWWDARLALEALRANGGPSDTIRVVITGLDLLFPRLVAHRGIKTLEELEDEEVAEWIWQRESELGQVVTAVGIGPKHLVWQSD